MIDQGTRAGNFNGLAADYERYRIGYSGELYDALEKLGLRRGAQVLDAGCGTGLSMLPLVARGMHLTGLDPSAEMLAIAGPAVAAATFVNGRVEAAPFPAGRFDAAVCAQAFHWFDGDRAYAELIRVVKPGGLVAVWWKMLASDDGMRSLRAAACLRAGVAPVPDPLRGGFSAFYRAPFAARTLRVFSFGVRVRVDEWIGYERSRAAVRAAYGPNRDAYIDALQAELVAKYGSAEARIDIRYVQYLYVGTTAL